MTLDWIKQWGFSSGVLGSIEYLFISRQVWISSMRQIDLFKNYSYSIKMLDDTQNCLQIIYPYYWIAIVTSNFIIIYNSWNNITVHKLLILHRNTWNYISVCKLFVLRIVTRHYNCLLGIIIIIIIIPCEFFITTFANGVWVTSSLL